MSWSEHDELMLDAIDAKLNAHHETHRTPKTGSCWCCCTECQDYTDPPEEIVKLQRDYFELAQRRQADRSWP